MAPSEETNKYLIEYRDAAGNLLLPQYGGCLHDWQMISCADAEETSDWSQYKCRKCQQHLDKKDSKRPDPPNLATPQGFFDLIRAMRAREDYHRFLKYCGSMGSSNRVVQIPETLIDEVCLPETVASYLKGLER